MKKPLDFPKRVTIEMTNDCNMSCNMCPRLYMQAPVGYMDEGLWQKLIDEISAHGSDLVMFWRGESAMHERFAPMMTYARSRVNFIQIATNGILGSLMGASILKADFISVSCHNMKGVEFAQQVWQSKWNYRRDHPILQASVVEGEPLEKSIKHILHNKIDRLRIYKKHSENGKFGAVKGFKNKERKFCKKLLNEIVVDYRGYVSRCCYDWNPDDPEMTVVDKSIEDVWKGKAYRTVRKTYPDKVCMNCDQWSDEVAVGTTELFPGLMETCMGKGYHL